MSGSGKSNLETIISLPEALTQIREVVGEYIGTKTVLTITKFDPNTDQKLIHITHIPNDEGIVTEFELTVRVFPITDGKASESYREKYFDYLDSLGVEFNQVSLAIINTLRGFGGVHFIEQWLKYSTLQNLEHMRNTIPKYTEVLLGSNGSSDRDEIKKVSSELYFESYRADAFALKLFPIVLQRINNSLQSKKSGPESDDKSGDLGPFMGGKKK